MAKRPNGPGAYSKDRPAPHSVLEIRGMVNQTVITRNHRWHRSPALGDILGPRTLGQPRPVRRWFRPSSFSGIIDARVIPVRRIRKQKVRGWCREEEKGGRKWEIYLVAGFSCLELAFQRVLSPSDSQPHPNCVCRGAMQPILVGILRAGVSRPSSSRTCARVAKHSAACQPGREIGKEPKYSSFEAYKMTPESAPMAGWREGGRVVS
jgi:hypothetical protein